MTEQSQNKLLAVDSEWFKIVPPGGGNGYELVLKVPVDSHFKEQFENLAHVKRIVVDFSHVSGRFLINDLYTNKEIEAAIGALVASLVERRTGKRPYTAGYTIDLLPKMSIRVNYQASTSDRILSPLIEQLNADVGVLEIQEDGMSFVVVPRASYLPNEVLDRVIKVTDAVMTQAGYPRLN